jgi:peroxiredoxin/outer membrane protein assembly factor BamD (BamD/ComL family)
VRYFVMALIFAVLAGTIRMPAAQERALEGPSNEKAQKTYKEAFQLLHEGRTDFALDNFKKADKQDGGHCQACQREIIKYGVQLRDWKTAETAAQEITSEAPNQKESALAHYQLGILFFDEGQDKNKPEPFARCHEEMAKALAATSNFPDAVYLDGRALAHLNQDDAAKLSFAQYVKMIPRDTPDRERAERYIEEPGLARARLAPPFSVTTLDGQRISLDELNGKVVLIDFWATWCGPCREALPHVREIARKFQGPAMVVLSVSVDSDEYKWKEFVAKNEMTWPQYFDRGFTGPVARLFGVEAIPHTFTIDADGVLQDERIGDADIEGKLKKLIKRAQQKQEKASAKKE